MTRTLQRRLPGVRFDVPAPALDDALPRMDVALFVGFAASGPLGVPVAVESLAEFEAVFGGEIVLLEAPDGSPVTGLLHPALRQFFSNGGVRAWVQRVAGTHARTTQFPLPQLLRLSRAAPDEAWQVEPAWIAARSPGAWADALRVALTLDLPSLAVRPAGLAGTTLSVQADGPVALALAPGDTLRIAIDAERWLQGRIASAGAAVSAGGTLRRALELDGLAMLQRWRGTPTVRHLGWYEPTRRSADGAAQRQVAASGTWRDDGRLALEATLPAAVRLEPGEVLRVAVDGGLGPAWLVLERFDASALGDAAGQVRATLLGRPWRVPARLPHAALQRWVDAGEVASAQWLRADLSATPPGGMPQHQAGLALAPRDDGGASLQALPDDEAYYRTLARPQRAERVVRSFERIERAAAAPPAARFPLASLALPGELVLLPLDIGVAPVAGLPARGIALPPLLRDGLDRFDWTLFAEAALADASADVLADRAEALRVAGRTPRPLRGLHALFGAAVDGPAEEPTLLVVPDAVQPGWQRKRRREPARRLHAAAPAPAAAPCGCFDDCAKTPLAAPAFLPEADPDAGGSYRVSWTRPEPQVRFELQEGSDRAFLVASLLYAGTDTALAVVARPRGVRWYRVRALDGLRTSPWSGVLEVRVGGSLYELRPWQPDNLLALHRLMLRAAAGRGDVLALLALPAHYRWADAIVHADTLRDAPAGSAALPPPLGPDESRAHSHAALYHPWLHTRRDAGTIACPPDGAVAGQLAGSALARGAWFAVANAPLRDVVALNLALADDERQALLEAQLNPVAAAPAGFVPTTAETLARDPDWRPVNVRRLMALLRRAALRRGAAYVFEPNGPALQRTVERAFEALLQSLYVRGAFAGRGAAQSFRVEVGDELNTPAQRDAGRFHVDLKVAPALPLSFLTVRLVRSGERLVSQEQR
ncbi:MAG: hypothetical protein KIT35_18480 [Piscinibacter sp.]|uniref:phage tail sheath C-terminal domain-containing protein n=1 Tax=Piscinibacter sp. TaxID=1903157 RepID=UPI0025850404|nr:phage tail sheath C-terminal domain-containing protein [Piscinibacter sp.]MCW5665821.1 hypothetical protein [Piscinibacter sp.]